MAVRQDKVQIQIEFITDEAKRLAATIEDTKRLNHELATAIKTGVGVDDAIKKVVAAGQSLAGIDLKNVMPAQLLERAKQLKTAMQFIPEMHPARSEMEKELQAINARMSEMNAKTKAVSGAMKTLHTEGGETGGFLTKAFSVFAGVGLLDAAKGVFSSIGGYLKDSLSAIDAAEKADAQLKATIKSTNGAAGKSFEELGKKASELQKITLFDDEIIKQGQGLLLTFTNIRGEVFDRATPALLDMSQALGQDVKSSAIQLGKALNDPIKGVTALSKVGVSFSSEQKNLIETLMKTNDVAGAQAVILKELEGEFGGSAKAAAEAGMGPFQLLQNRMGEVSESVGKLMSFGLKPLQPILVAVVEFMESLTDSLVSGEKATGKYGTAVNVASAILKVLGQVFSTVFETGKILYEFVFVPLAKSVVGLGWATSELIGWFADLIQKASEIPIIGILFKGLADNIGLVKDILTNASASFAGFRAAAAQAIENVKNGFNTLVINLEIVGAKIASALSIDSRVKEAGARYIAQLEAQKSAMSAAGKSVGDAYTEARNKAIADAKAAEAIADSAATKGVSVKYSVGGGDDEDDEKEAKKAESLAKKAFDLRLKNIEVYYAKEEIVLDRKRLDGKINEERYQEELAKSKMASYDKQLAEYAKSGKVDFLEAQKISLQKLKLEKDTRKTLLELELKGISEATTSRKVAAENDYLNSIKSLDVATEQGKTAFEEAERLHKRRLILIDTEGYRQQLSKLKQFGDDKTKEATETENKILKNKIELQQIELKQTEADEKKKTAAVTKQAEEEIHLLEDANRIEEGILKDKFAKAILSEQAFAMKKLQFKRALIADEIAILEQGGEAEKAKARKLGDELLKTDEDIEKKKIENKKRTHDLEGKLQEAKISIAKDALDIGIEFLSQDAESRKKHAGAIKAFQIGQTWVNAYAEISGIWKNANENPLNALIPGWGPIFAGIQTAFSLARATSATAKIANQKFARGALLGDMSYSTLGGNTHANGGTKGYFEDGTVVEMERGEVLAVVNAQNAPMLKMLSQINGHAGNGNPYFATGGLLLPNTTPNPSAFFRPQVNTFDNSNQNDFGMMEMIFAQMMGKFDEVTGAIEKHREVKFYRNKLEDATAQDTRDRDSAAWNF